MRRKHTDEEKERLARFLKDKIDIRKIEEQSDEMKRMLAREQLLRKKPAEPTFQQRLYNFQVNARKRLFELYRYYSRPHNKHLIMLTAFVVFSTYVCWRMEDRYYKMRQHVESTKSFKQQQIEKEKRYIDTMLARKTGDFQSVPIGQQYEPNIKYKFQHLDGDSDIDTKGQLFNAMRKDYLAGKPIPEQFLEEFFEVYPDLKNSI